jgi:hypothetical protein
VRGIAAALLICAGGLALRGAERLLDIDAGAVLAAANERATERKHTPRKETPS